MQCNLKAHCHIVDSIHLFTTSISVTFKNHSHISVIWYIQRTLERVRHSPTISTCRYSRCLGVLLTHARRTVHEDAMHPECVQNLHPGDSAIHLEFYHWLYTNCQVLPLILPTDEATFNCNGISNTLTCINCLMTIHMVLWKQNFSIISLSMCGAVWLMICWLVPLL